VVVIDHLPPGEEGKVFMSPPPDLKIDDADLVPPLREPLHEVMALVRPDLHPIRFLDYEYSHTITLK